MGHMTKEAWIASLPKVNSLFVLGSKLGSFTGWAVHYRSNAKIEPLYASRNHSRLTIILLSSLHLKLTRILKRTCSCMAEHRNSPYDVVTHFEPSPTIDVDHMLGTTRGYPTPKF